MVCETELDLSYETEGWQSDYSLIKSMEKDVVSPMRWIDEATAKVLLRPLVGTCVPTDIDIWRYNICIGKKIEQILLPSGQ